jgi:hypothetical protein
MMATDTITAEPDAPPPGTHPDQEWKTNRRTGREFVSAVGRSGVIYREGSESVEQAHERDRRERAEREAQTGDPNVPRRGKNKPKRPAMPEASRKVDLKQLEHELAEGLKAPAIVAATFGDEWAAQHFQSAGPYLARSLVAASEHNPWLRRKLEEAATGEAAMMMMISLVGVAGALVTYLVPPVVYWFNLPVSQRTRDLFGLPPRKEPAPPYATSENGGQPAPAPDAPPVSAPAGGPDPQTP